MYAAPALALAADYAELGSAAPATDYSELGPAAGTIYSQLDDYAEIADLADVPAAGNPQVLQLGRTFGASASSASVTGSPAAPRPWLADGGRV